MLELTQLSLTRGRRIFDTLSIALEPGKIYSIVGPNGVGKSSLLDLISAWISPDAGFVHINGHDVHALAPEQRVKHINYLPVDETLAFEMSVHNYFELSGVVQFDDEIIQALDLPLLLRCSYQSLSSGQRARVRFAKSLMLPHCSVRLLDEFNANLDIAYAKRCFKLLRERICSYSVTLIALHDPSLAWQWADEVLMLNNGYIERYQSAEAYLKALESSFRVPFELLEHNANQYFLPLCTGG